jgi:hypothetical protein
MLGNFPQAMTHMALVNTARLLSMPEAEAKSAARQGERPATAGVAPVAAASAADQHDQHDPRDKGGNGDKS